MKNKIKSAVAGKLANKFGSIPEQNLCLGLWHNEIKMPESVKQARAQQHSKLTNKSK